MSASLESGKWFWLSSCHHSACQRPCRPTLLGGWHSVLVRVFTWKCLAPSPFPSLHITLKPSWLLFLFGNPRCRSTKWETTSELRDHKFPWSASATEEGEPEERGEKGGFGCSFPKFLEIILFSNFPHVICGCTLAGVGFLSGNLRPSSQHLCRVNEWKS